MEKHEKIAELEVEINLIQHARIREWISWAVGELPDYFFKIPASSTGKYHPQYATGEGGLLRHTKAAVRIAHTIMATETFGKHYPSLDRDMIIAALIIHDGLKKGMPEEKYTRTDHPLLVRQFFTDFTKTEHAPELPENIRNNIFKLIESHMGQWNKDKDGKEILPKPCCTPHRLVHLADYLASRKMLEFNFEAQF
jgi:hypothetical protein